MLPKALFLLSVSLLLSSCSDSLNEPITFFQVQTPRPFGYVIGDEIKQRIIVEARQGLALQYKSIPGKSEVNRWLNLNQVNIDKIKTNHGIRYQIDLTYQLFYAPLTVKMLELPGFTLQFRQFGNSIEKTVPRWHFTASPLRELAIRKADGKEYMRPDSAAPLLDYSPVLARLYLFLAIVLILATYLAWIFGLLTFLPKYQLFRRPSRQLAGLSNNELPRMLTIMHNALNQLNGKPLFAHQMAAFYQRFPAYQRLDEELNWFFNCSNRHFFSPGHLADNYAADKIRALCQHCLQIERGQR